MKRFLLSLLVALALIPAFAQLQSGPLSPVNRFLDEYVTLKGFIKSNNKHAELMYEREYAPPRLINGVEYVDAFISSNEQAGNCITYFWRGQCGDEQDDGDVH